MAQKINRQRLTPKPEKVTDAVSRGQMLKHLIDASKTTTVDFAEVTGIKRNTLQRWLAGTIDLANASRAHVDRILTGLGLDDEDAWELFAIPEELRADFRRDRPMHDVVGNALCLPTPLFGEVSIPAGATVRYSQSGDSPYMLIRLRDGTYYAVRSLSGLRGGEVLGVLLGVSFAHESAIPGPARSAPRS